MTILQAQTDLSNIAAAIDRERELSDTGRKNIANIIASVRETINAGLDALLQEIEADHNARADALKALIGAPDPVEFRQAAE